MALLLMLSACNDGTFRGPWGAWVLYGDGERTALAADEVPAVLDATEGLVTSTQADAVVAPLDLAWHGQVVVDGRGLLVAWLRSLETAYFVGLDGVVVHTVSEVALDPGWGNERRSDIARQLSVGVDPSGGLVMVHPIDAASPKQMRIHRWQGAGWSWTDVDQPNDGRFRGRVSQLTAWQDQVAWIDDEHLIRLQDGVVATQGGLDRPEGVLFEPDGTLVQLGWRWENEREGRAELYGVLRPGCELALERGEASLVPGPTGIAEVFHIDEQDLLTRTPVAADCGDVEPRISWPGGYVDREAPPVRWGGDGVFAGIFDQDPVYLHPDPRDQVWELALGSSDFGGGDTGYYY